jgi:hypothetical protein
MKSKAKKPILFSTCLFYCLSELLIRFDNRERRDDHVYDSWAEMTGAIIERKNGKRELAKMRRKKSLDRSFIILVLHNHRPNEYRGLGRFSFSFFLLFLPFTWIYDTFTFRKRAGGNNNNEIGIKYVGEYRIRGNMTHHTQNIHAYRETFFVETFILYNTRHVVVISIKTKLMALSLTGVLLT